MKALGLLVQTGSVHHEERGLKGVEWKSLLKHHQQSMGQMDLLEQLWALYKFSHVQRSA